MSRVTPSLLKVYNNLLKAVKLKSKNNTQNINKYKITDKMNDTILITNINELVKYIKNN